MRWLTEMGVFAKVVEAGSFSKAAGQLGLNRSAVSKHVSRLEDGLEVRLLHRTTRALSLTEAGRSVYEQCARMADAAEEAIAAAGRLSTTARGTLRVSASVAFGHLVLVPLLPKLLERHPEMAVELALVDRFVDLAEEGFDIVLRLTDDPPATSVARQVLAVEFVLCASPAYVRRRGRPQRPADLSDHNCIRQGHPVSVDTWHFTGAHGSEQVKVHGNMVLTGSEPIRSLLLEGLGCGILPDFLVADDLRRKKLVRLLPDWQPRARFTTLYALYLPTRQGNPKVRAFIDFLLESLPQKSS